MNNYCYYDYQIAHVQQNNSTTAPFPSSAATPKRKPWEPKFVERIFFFFFYFSLILSISFALRLASVVNIVLL